MSRPNPQLVGSVFERNPSSKTAGTDPKFAGSSRTTGFPTVQHRSKSAFARGRDELKKRNEVATANMEGSRGVVPIVQPHAKPVADTDALRQQISDENAKAVEAMSEEQREQERKDIFEHFGPGVDDLLKRARERRAQREEEGDAVPETKEKPQIATPPPSALSPGGTRPSSRADRRLRFAAVTPDDVHVYESAPPSPRRKALILPPPPDITDAATTSLGKWSGQIPPAPEPEPEKGTPEDIRRRFFPNALAFDPSLAWMNSTASEEGSPESAVLRFDLTGTAIPAAVSMTLPTHLGLHHHADGTHAGYTLDDLFLLSRSSVPAQRTTMLDVLGRIARKLGKGEIEELKGRDEELRKRIVAAGVEAMGERGSLGARAVEIIWECVVGWDEGVTDIHGVELEFEENSGGDTISSLPLEHVLSQISTLLAQATLPPRSLSQLLAILHRLAQHTNPIADTITTTPDLVTNVIRTFLLMPYPPSDSSPLPNPSALDLLTTLALASRTSASALVAPADAILRFLTILPPVSSYPVPLINALLTSTLTFYTTLASYGLYAHIATTAAACLTALKSYILSDVCTSAALVRAWAGLLEAWTVCAIDPHYTTPEHDILWTQVVGWDWAADLLELRGKLGLGTVGGDVGVWAAMWHAQAAGLEGAQVNGVRGGEEERGFVVSTVRGGFEGGQERDVLVGALDAMQGELLALKSDEDVELRVLRNLAGHADVVMAAVRLWLGTLPSAMRALASPPFILPFSKLSELCATLVSHPLWSLLQSNTTLPHIHVFLRSLTSLLAYYIRLSRVLPAISQDLWMAQALSVLCRLVPGDEEFGVQLLADAIGLINPDMMSFHGYTVPTIIWERGGMEPIMPFLTHTIRPDAVTYIGPKCCTPRSISLATTQRVPRRIAATRDSGLPLARDWALSSLDHLLRSATSSVLKALPPTWNASETEVVRASFLLAKVVRDVLQRYSLGNFVITREETVFACMKVFMLEHEQPQSDSAEVFRDGLVEKFMDELLAPFTAAAVSHTSSSFDASKIGGDLEKVATRFLGVSTPFYQYYTDFVALYDSISFSHPLFARLLLPPTSMRYPPDYRKHLWGDFGHVIRTVQTPIEQVVTGDLREYLWPVETDVSMLASYLQALIKNPLGDFMRFVAVHHVAHNLWPDLHGTKESDRTSRLLKTIVEQGGGAVVREVLRYRQIGRDQPLLLPPACFAQDGDWKTSRVLFIGRYLGEEMQSRLSVVINEEPAA